MNRKRTVPSITYHFTVSLPVELDEEFTLQDAEAVQTRRELERALFKYLQGWRAYPNAADVELTDYELHLPNPREKGDDDGREYGHPREAQEDRLR